VLISLFSAQNVYHNGAYVQHDTEGYGASGYRTAKTGKSVANKITSEECGPLKPFFLKERIL
jgi:hypothetical protein